MGRQILIVDALPTRRIVMQAKLGAAHYGVIMANDLADARKKLRETSCDVIFVDAGLDPIGDLDAHGFCREVKDNPTLKHIPVLLTTDAIDEPDVCAAFRTGFNDVIRRPVGERVLLAQLRAVMRKCAADGREFHTSSVLTDLADARTPALKPAQVCIIGRSRLLTQTCADALTAEARSRLDVDLSDFAELLARPPERDPFETIIMMIGAGEEEAALTQLSDLRSSCAGAEAGLILMMEEERSSFAARAYDMGADCVVSGRIGMQELALRASLQARHKQGQDALRRSVHDGLRLAVKDPLTGLYNRRYATRKLAQIAGAGQQYGLLLMDLDHFKQVNDIYGHAAGDAVLTHIAQTLISNLRDSDLLARIGGEEFLVALPGASREQAVGTAERIRQMIDRTPIQATVEGGPLRVTLSIGLYHSSGEQLSVDDLIARADTALYRSKAHGRNRVSISKAA